ncbi:DUF1217 domain-containing protein [Paracoccus aminophilus]|uniref:Flagellar basal-body rod protein FlgF n=1 Tax=Paracoccus aminophilus JCM 7686 TaxID=1367847 RepID=S5YCR8_PARAH|nr:DUF1217 domain-containing protein [Paracoccus aminophilus]AGT09248.1 flagellar basal-body rod protein FlgF [Paracoccus aminophilus JCM 7686]
MSFSPFIGSGAYLGWSILNRNLSAQKGRLSNSPDTLREQLYFSEKSKKTNNIDDLLSDYRMLRFALTSFGLEGDISNKAFIKKVMTSDLNDNRSFANRLGDKRYAELAKELSGLSRNEGISLEVRNQISNRYVDKKFETLVGEQDNNLRLALSGRAEISLIASSTSSESTKWYLTLASKPLKEILLGAFGFDKSFGKLPLDRQISDLKVKMQKTFGCSNIEIFKDGDNIEKLMKNFLLRRQLEEVKSGISDPYATALSILSRR